MLYKNKYKKLLTMSKISSGGEFFLIFLNNSAIIKMVFFDFKY